MTPAVCSSPLPTKSETDVCIETEKDAIRLNTSQGLEEHAPVKAPEWANVNSTEDSFIFVIIGQLKAMLEQKEAKRSHLSICTPN